MALLSKQYAGSATASERRVFLLARFKLTGAYVGILTVILAGFSAILYQNISHNLIDASEDTFAGPSFHQHFVEDTLRDVRNEIMLVDLIILAIAAAVSYVLAGYTLRPIQRALNAQKKFAENASHELRTPLAVMKNDIEILMRSRAPTAAETHATLRNSVEEIDRLSGMVADLLSLARSDHRTAVDDHIDMNALIASVIATLARVAEAKGASLSLETKNAIFVRGNPHDLRRVFLNIFQNAIDHMPQGGSVTVHAQHHGTEVAFEVRDTGSGINARDVPRVFDRFYKGEESSGTGLGLSIVKTIVEAHGGTVQIWSVVGKGTTVQIRLNHA